MPAANAVGNSSGGIVYTAVQSVAITGGATQDFAITELPSGFYLVYGTIVATGLDTGAATVAFQPFIDTAGSVQSSGQEFLHTNGGGTAARLVTISTFPAMNVHFTLASSNATVPVFPIPIVYGSRIRVVRNSATTGTVVVSMIFMKTTG